MLRLLAVILALVTIAFQSSVCAQEATLKPGDPAPALSPAKWLKGEAVTSLEKGKIYVVEFWATWCGPCRESIPHLTELQKKYKDVIFIGQSVWEQDQTKVEPFVKEMGDKMNYRVAQDDAEQGKMAAAWMQAAGQDGIPTAFIIDKDTKIAWIGHPMEMGTVLGEIVSGSFDPKTAADDATKLEALQDKLTSAMQSSDFDTALSTLDELQKLDASRAADIDAVRFQVLIQKKDFPAACKAADRLAESQKQNADILNMVAWTLVDPKNPVENPDLAVAEKCASRAVEASGSRRGDILDTLARVYFLQGKIDKAVELQTKAVQEVDEDEMKKELQKTLEMYKAKKP